MCLFLSFFIFLASESGLLSLFCIYKKKSSKICFISISGYTYIQEEGLYKVMCSIFTFALHSCLLAFACLLSFGSAFFAFACVLLCSALCAMLPSFTPFGLLHWLLFAFLWVCLLSKLLCRFICSFFL